MFQLHATSQDKILSEYKVGQWSAAAAQKQEERIVATALDFQSVPLPRLI